MAKKEKKEKGFMESVHDGYIRGSMGGEEDTSQARTVTSPEPLPDEIKKFRKLYILVPISLIIGILKGDFTGWLAIAAFILLCLVCLIDTYVNLEEDGTFVIWWRMSVAKAFLSTRHYPIYKNAIAAMGIIAYEVQQVFPVVEEA